MTSSRIASTGWTPNRLYLSTGYSWFKASTSAVEPTFSTLGTAYNASNSSSAKVFASAQRLLAFVVNR